MSASRQSALTLSALVLAVTLATVLALGRSAGGNGAVGRSVEAAPLAQSGLTDAYRLVDTWDGTSGQGAPGSVLFPAGIDATDDTVVLVDRGNHRLQRFAPDGQFLAAWGTHGSGVGELDGPRDVAIDGDRVYVTDTGNGRVVVLALDGTQIDAWQAPDLAEPWGIAVVGGRAYVTHRSGGEVVVFEDGSVVARWTGLVEPRGVSVAADGRVAVADYGASEVRYFRPDGSAAGKLSTNLPPTDVVVDVLGDVYVQSDGAVLWYPSGSSASRQAMYYDGMQGLALTTKHGIFATVARTTVRDALPFHGVVRYPWQPPDGLPTSDWPLLGFPPGRLNGPHAVHVGPSGSIWILDGWPRLQSFNAAGVPGSQLTLETGVVPVDVVESPSGELLVGETRRLLRVQPTGEITQFVRLGLGTTNYWLTALAWREGLPRVSVLDSALMHVRDYGVTRTLMPIGSWPLDPGGTWSLVWDLAAPSPNPSSRLYVVNRGAHRIDVYDGRNRVDSWPIEGIPIRAAVGPDDHLFVLSVDGIVRKLTDRGAVVAAWDAGAFSATRSEVVDLAVDAEGRVYTIDRAAHTVQVWEIDPTGTPEPPASQGGACKLRGDKRAEPEALRLGEEVTVRLQVGGDCPNTSPRADIVLAIDRSGSMMDSNKITATREAALVFINQIDLSRDRVGIVTFNNTGRVEQPLTSDRALAEAAVRRITAVGGTNIADAIRVSTDELFGSNSRPDTQPVIVLLTDGRDRQPDDALEAARVAQSRGTRVFTIGFGDVDPMVMVLSATTPEDHYYAPDTTTLADIYTEIARRITAEVLATAMTVVDEVPANMRYVTGSAQPAAQWDAGRRTLTWTLTRVPFSGIEMSFRIEPTALGRHPTNVEASADYVDGLDQAGDLRFPVPQVEVLSLEPTATSTSTPFPTPTPRPTDTPPPPEPIFLPLALHQQCRPEAFYADVALVMDTSSSMQWPSTEGGPSKLSVAVAAAHAFVGLLNLPGDQLAIISFNNEAELTQPLTGDMNAMRAGLDSLEPQEGTRIDRGIETARAELTSERADPSHNQVMILLTDGRSSSVDDSVVRARADEAKSDGISIYTIGLGDDVDSVLLQEIATYPEYAFLAPTAEELEQIYRDIAFTLECPNLRWP